VVIVVGRARAHITGRRLAAPVVVVVVIVVVIVIAALLKISPYKYGKRRTKYEVKRLVLYGKENRRDIKITYGVAPPL
jgi:hypothetical protein